MSIIARYIRLPADKWQSLSEAPKKDFDDYQDSLRGTNSMMLLSGDWQAIHFLLTGKIAHISDTEIREPTSEPLESVVMGGVDTKFVSVYGNVKFLSPEVVKKCSTALNQVTEAYYGERLTPDAFNDAEIYPYDEANPCTEDELEALPDVLDSIKWFFGAASEEHQAILIDL